MKNVLLEKHLSLVSMTSKAINFRLQQRQEMALLLTPKNHISLIYMSVPRPQAITVEWLVNQLVLRFGNALQRIVGSHVVITEAPAFIALVNEGGWKHTSVSKQVGGVYYVSRRNGKAEVVSAWFDPRHRLNLLFHTTRKG